MNIMPNNKAIGIFDSGIGGLTVANAVFSLLPNEQVIYVGDTARIPYGNKTQADIINYSFEIIDFLLSKECKAIVIACNTASAAALNAARENWPNIPFIGMEPAIKPAAQHTQSGKVGVLATAGTFKSQRYAKLMEAHTKGIELIQNPCIGLVKLIENQKTKDIETKKMLQSILLPMKEKGADTFVLGCTHYPFVKPLIEEIIGADDKGQIIDPAPAIARQLKKRLSSLGLENENTRKTHQFYATGGQASMEWAIRYLLKQDNINVLTFNQFR